MAQVKGIVAFRHGVYARNRRIDRVDDDVRATAYDKAEENEDYTADLEEEGRVQAEALRVARKNLGIEAVAACLYSPYLRTASTARIVFPENIPMKAAPGLCERDLGDFANLPRKVFHEDYPESLAFKREYPLYWRPNNGETLQEVGWRVLDVLELADEVGPGEIVAFSTHADTMVAMRGLAQLGGMTNKQLQQPLTKKLRNPQWIQNCQVDMYMWDKGATRGVDRPYFRSVATSGDQPFDTGWLQIPS